MPPLDDRPGTDRPVDPAIDPSIRRQATINQTRAAMQWTDTAEDITLGNIVRAREETRETRHEVLLLAIVGFVVLVVGILWSMGTIQHDRLVAQERAAGQATPYRPNSSVANPAGVR